MVIDELTVILGLDARRFSEGQRDALAAFKKTKEGAAELATSVEQHGAKIGDLFGLVRRGALGLVGAIAGGEIAGFIDHIVRMDAATGRMARNINTSVANLSAWQYMIQRVGGSAESATSALSTMQQHLDAVRQGREKPSPGLINLANQAGFNVMGTEGADSIYRKVQSFISGQIGSGRMTANQALPFLNSLPGMNQDMANLMLGDFKKIEESVRAQGTAIKETADAAEALQKRFSLLTQAMERFGASMLPWIDYFTKKTSGEIASEASKSGVLGWIDSKTGPIFEPGSNLERFSNWAGSTLFGYGGTGAGGSRGDRNNNPGNIKDGPFARAHGATGSDGTFAVFPDRATGAAAQEALVRGKSYQGLTLDEFGNKYSEGNAAWKKTVGGALGIGPNDIVNNQDPRLIEAIRRAEGTGARGSAAGRGGGASSRTSTSTSEVNIGTLNVNAPNAQDADGVASGMGSALRRQSLIAPVNSGLTG